MRLKLVSIVLLLGIVFVFIFETSFFSSSCSEGSVKTVFSPDNSEEIFSLVKSAKREIKLEVYEFSYKKLADALISSKQKGVEVKVILEPSVYQNNQMFDYLLNSGIDTNWAPKKFFNTHSKFAIIDDSVVLVGSTNWSKNGMDNNREASVIIYSTKIASEFEKIFDSDFFS